MIPLFIYLSRTLPTHRGLERITMMGLESISKVKFCKGTQMFVTFNFPKLGGSTIVSEISVSN